MIFPDGLWHAMRLRSVYAGSFISTFFMCSHYNITVSCLLSRIADGATTE